MNYMQIDSASISNGNNVRVVLWCSGCNMKCKGCFNQETWEFSAGKQFDESAKNNLFTLLSKPYIQGITFSGGHPLESENLLDIYSLIQEIKSKLPNKDVWLYTGYKIEAILWPVVTDNLDIERDRIIELRRRIVGMCDVVVDGPYIEEQRDITLSFRGSKNQRLVDVKKTIETKEIVLWNE